jgi:hypothetical protein
MESGMWFSVYSEVAPRRIILRIGNMGEEEIKREIANKLEANLITHNDLMRMAYSPKEQIIYRYSDIKEGEIVFNNLIHIIDELLFNDTKFIDIRQLVDGIKLTLSENKKVKKEAPL